MSDGLNKVLLIGNLGTDPDVKYTQANQARCGFRLAVNESYKDKASGEFKDRTEWVTVVAWGATAENCGRYLAKGRQVYVEGRLNTRQWEDREGKKRYTTEVVAQRVLFLGGKDGGTPRPVHEDLETTVENGAAAQARGEDPATDMPF